MWCRFLLSKFTAGCVRELGAVWPSRRLQRADVEGFGCSYCCQRITSASRLNLDRKYKYMFDFSFPISCFKDPIYEDLAEKSLTAFI